MGDRHGRQEDAARHGRTFDRIARVGLAERNALDLIDTIRKEMQAGD